MKDPFEKAWSECIGLSTTPALANLKNALHLAALDMQMDARGAPDPAVVEVLRELEWPGGSDNYDSDPCPVCGGETQPKEFWRCMGKHLGHAPDCRMARALRSLGESVEMREGT